ncbi:MAG: ATP-binding protein [Burkholderiales bacterium]
MPRKPLLFERDAELGYLRGVVESTQSGSGASAAIVGPAGIGKSALLEFARDEAARLGVAWVSACGGELESEFAFGIVRQLFEGPVLALGVGERGAVLEGAAAFAAPIIGLADPGHAQSTEPRFAVLHGLYWLCANLAQRGPFVLAVDDLQWADQPSLHFLAYLQRRVAELPVSILTAARPTSHALAAGLIEAVTARPEVVRLTPAPLSQAAVAALIGAELAEDPAADLINACYRATAGNPFFCTTLATELRGRPFNSVESVRTIAQAERAIASVVHTKLGRLDRPSVALTRAVATLGPNAEFRHATALADLDERVAVESLDALTSLGILCAEPALAFTHPLMRTAVYESSPPAERARLHAHVARMFFDEGANPERIALHLLVTEPAARDWVIEALRAAAHRLAHTAPGSAVSYLRRALREPPTELTRAALLWELGVAELNAGEPEPAANHLRDSLALTHDEHQRAGIARDLSLALATPGHYGEAVEVLDRSVAALRELDPDTALCLEAELHQCALMDPAQYAIVRRRFERFDMAIAGQSKGERARLAALATEMCLRTANAAEVRTVASRAFECGLLADLSAYSSLWANASFPLIFADGFGVAESVVAKAISDARWRSSPISGARAYAVRAMLRFRQGLIPDAESDARTAAEFGLQAGFQIALLPLGVLVESLIERGELGAADQALVEAGKDGAIPERFLDNWILHARGWLRLAQGRLDAARIDFQALGDRGERGWWPWNPGMFAYRSGLALTLHRLGETASARRYAQEEVEFARRWQAPRAQGIALRTLGQVSGGQVSARSEGIDTLRESVAVLESSGAALEYARSLTALGAAIRRDGRRLEARDVLTDGFAIAHRCGGAALAKLAHDELVATGARPRRAARIGVESLSPSELRVARLAVDGLTNREIAQALFITLRTVEVHLTHAYQKLSISSRDELSAQIGTRDT